MRLKKLKKGEEYGSLCAAAKCESEAVMAYGAGVKFDKKRGEVPLCDKHNEKLIAESEPTLVPTSPAANPEDAPQEETALMPPPTFRAALVEEATEAGEALQLIREFEIKEQADYDFANEALGQAKSSWKELDTRKKKATGPLSAALKEIRSWFKPPQDFYAEAESLLKQKLADAHRAAAEAQDAALAAAQEAHATGDVQAVREAMVQSATVEVTQAANVSVIESWDFEVTDPNALPREYLEPDLKKIQGVVRVMGEGTSIPGVRVFTKETVVRRGA